eukprot:1546659-Pleurochrysis_carterae.AAC.1
MRIPSASAKEQSCDREASVLCCERQPPRRGQHALRPENCSGVRVQFALRPIMRCDGGGAGTAEEVALRIMHATVCVRMVAGTGARKRR